MVSMLNRRAKDCHRDTVGSSILIRVKQRWQQIWAISCIVVLIVGCAEVPVQGRQITAAAPIRHAQFFDTELISTESNQCVVRTKLPDQRLAGTWIDERNSALRAALSAAKRCCGEPRLVSVEDWMVGFTAYEATFVCAERGE